MKNKFIISEEEKNRILGLHETAKSNPGTVLSEQALGVAFGPEMNGLKIKKVEATEQSAGQPQQMVDPKVKYKDNIAKVDSYLPFNTQEFQDVLNKVKSGQGMLIDVLQPFLKNQKLLEKINPEGYQMATTSGWKNYKSLITNQSITGNEKAVYTNALNDLISIKGALRTKAAELSGLASTPSPWAKTDMGKKVIDAFAKSAGIMA